VAALQYGVGALSEADDAGFKRVESKAGVGVHVITDPSQAAVHTFLSNEAKNKSSQKKLTAG
jgi:hypothetical protein